jgi:uncharacterized Zn finger protein
MSNGLALAKAGDVRVLSPTLFVVRGTFEPFYYVNLREEEPQCTCTDHSTRIRETGGLCKHVWAVRYTAHCERCGKTWCTGMLSEPDQCVGCGSRDWNWR